MSVKINIVIIILCLTSGFTLDAQSLSNKGKEFWVGYGHHQFMEGINGSTQEMILYFSAEQKAHVTVTINGTAYREEYDIPANSVVPSKLIPKGLASGSVYDARLYTRPPGFPGGTGSEGVFKKHGIHIESDVPIVAYAHIYGGQASGASMLMPVETWGYSYVALNTRQTYNTNGKGDCFSWIYIVAKQNNTRVRIVPSANTRNGKPAGVAFDVDLQKGEIFQLMGALIDVNNGYDLTGTSVQSIANDQGECYPVAVFVGSSRTAVTCDNTSTGSGDNIMQQIFPYQAWGKRYLTAPTSVDASAKLNNLNVFRILVRDANTIVKKNGQQLFGFNKYYYEYQSDKADYIEADKPILVAQYIPSESSCGYSGIGDPELMYLSPIEQSIKQIGFFRNTKDAIAVNYLTLIIPTKGISSLMIDGATNAYTHAYTHPNMPGYSVVIKRWTAAPAQCIVKSDSAFTAITYGLGSAESYGYNAGTLINNLSGIVELKNTYNSISNSNTYTCANTPVQLSVLMRYQPTKMQWKLSELSGKLSPATDINNDAPAASSTQILNGITFYRYTLPGSYVFNEAGIYKIPLMTTHPTVETCNNSEEIQYQVEVKAALKTDFDIAYNNCNASERISFTGKETFENGDSVSNWNWSFPDATTAAGKSIQHLFQAGEHDVKLLAVSKEGCVADTTKKFKLSEKPALPVFSHAVDFPCEDKQFTFTETNPEPGVKKWYWDFGNNDTVTATIGDPQRRAFENYGKVTVKHVVMLNNGCVSDTAKQVITIYAKPSLSFQYPKSCLMDGVVQFKSTTTVPDGQAINPEGYAWNFGDDQATQDNPNASTLANPSHTFRYGTYNIKYAATTVNGCVSDSSFKVAVNIQPQLIYSALSNVCQSQAGSVTVAKATITNEVSGTGIYRGPATDSAGNFNPAVAGPGIHRIGFFFISDSGCTDSIFQTITVYPQPNIDAGPSFTVTQGTWIQFNSNVIDSTRLVYSWSPPTALSNPTVLRPSLVALQDQKYTLTAISEYGCKALDFLTVTILKTVKIPSAFSPNGDGVNDRWEISSLAEYPGASIQVFNRYGQQVFYSVGYATPWNGSYNGKPLPIGTYYYVLNRKNGYEPLSGSVTILK